MWATLEAATDRHWLLTSPADICFASGHCGQLYGDKLGKDSVKFRFGYGILAPVYGHSGATHHRRRQLLYSILGHGRLRRPRPVGQLLPNRVGRASLLCAPEWR
jgi:hypothetical protein